MRMGVSEGNEVLSSTASDVGRTSRKLPVTSPDQAAPAPLHAVRFTPEGGELITGGADKAQVQAMLKVLLPGAAIAGADAADALAVAIADAHLGQRAAGR